MFSGSINEIKRIGEKLFENNVKGLVMLGRFFLFFFLFMYFFKSNVIILILFMLTLFILLCEEAFEDIVKILQK